MWKKAIILILIALLHFSVSFVSWSLHPGNVAIETSGIYSAMWTVLSFPLITLLPGSIIEMAFMPLLFVNSCIWSVMILATLRLTRAKLNPPRRVPRVIEDDDND
jgi:hypothetical protein